jgi:adenosylcobinamide-GDP ribazoletransferase
MLADLAAAFTLLTRLPVWRLSGGRAPADLASAVWAFPLVGLVVGGLGGLTFWLTSRLTLPPFLGACTALTVTVLVTGAFHEDGLADVADGLGGGRTKEDKLAIMRDSRIGTYGALALVISSLFRVGAIATLTQPGRIIPALIAAGMLGRAGMIMLPSMLEPARADGLAAGMSKPEASRIFVGLALTLVAAFGLLPFKAALSGAILSSVACLVFTAIARRQVGGYTGDILGATENICEIAALIAIVSVSSPGS